MRKLLFTFITLVILKCLVCLHLLMMGSSVDRYMVTDICEHFHLIHQAWGNNSIADVNLKQQHPATLCVTPRFQIASIHLFGSNPVGPYLHGFKNTDENPFIDSIDRINVTLSLYLSQFGKYPDRIMFSSGIWDCYVHGKITNESTEWPAIVSTFSRNIKDRLDQIEAIVGVDTDVGVRTDVLYDESGDILHAHNSLIRTIAATRNLSIYDYDADLTALESTPQRFLLMRDRAHPRARHQIAAVFKMLGLTFSKEITLRGDVSNKLKQRFEESLLSRNEVTDVSGVSLIRASVESIQIENSPFVPVYFFNAVDMKRYSNATANFMKVLRLSSADIMDIDGSLMDKILLGGELPKIEQDRSTFYNCTNTHDLWYLRENRRCKVANPEELQLIGSYVPVQTINIADCSGGSIFMSIECGDPLWLPLGAMFHDGAVIRPTCSRELFYIFNGSKHSIPNMDTFFSLNVTLNDLLPAPCSPLFYSIMPTGDSWPAVA